MLEYGVGDVLFRILRRGGVTGQTSANFYMVDGPAGNLEKFRDAFAFKIDRVYSTFQEILERFTQIATAVAT